MRITKDRVQGLSDDAATLSRGSNIELKMILPGVENGWDTPGYTFNTALADSIKGRNSTRHAAFFLFGAINGWNRYEGATLPFSVTQYCETLGHPTTAAEWDYLYRGWSLAELLYLNGDIERPVRPDILTMSDYYERAILAEPNVSVRFMTTTGSNPFHSSVGVEFYGRVVGTTPHKRQLRVRPWGQRHTVTISMSQLVHVY